MGNTVRLQRLGDDLLVFTGHYDPDWSRYARGLDGQWEPLTRAWRFAGDDEDAVRSIIGAAFGVEPEVIP